MATNEAKVDAVALLAEVEASHRRIAGRFRESDPLFERTVRRADEAAEARAAVATLTSEADKAAKMLHNITEAWVPAHLREAFHRDAADLRAALARVRP